ncbi:MAG TPA: GNAT family N-acetyltransferase [Acidimicrobiales bacterium]|nr:GNAT family N-acetyltransferase [Acidimicrobiales bacterium]
MSDLADRQLRFHGSIWLQEMGTHLAEWFSCVPGYRHSKDGDGWIALSGEDYAGFNVGCVLDRPDASAVFDRYSDMIGPLPAAIVVERLTPSVLSQADQVGARHIGQIPFMAREAGGSRQPESVAVDVQPAANLGDVTPAAVLFADSFSANLQACINMFEPMLNNPSTTLWLGEIEGEVISTAVALHSGTTVGIYCLATTRPLRRQGHAGALVRGIMASQLSTGARSFYLHTTSLERNFSEEIGFKPVAWHDVFLLNDTTDRSSRLVL